MPLGAENPLMYKLREDFRQSASVIASHRCVEPIIFISPGREEQRRRRLTNAANASSEAEGERLSTLADSPKAWARSSRPKINILRHDLPFDHQVLAIPCLNQSYIVKLS